LFSKKFLVLVLLASFAFAAPCGKGGGIWVVSGPETCSGAINVSNLTIQSGASLLLEDATLTIADAGWIKAEPGSSLAIRNSTVDVYSLIYPVPSDKRFYFVVDGASFEFSNSTLKHCGDSTGESMFGLLIKNSDFVLVKNSVFEDNFKPLRTDSVCLTQDCIFNVTNNTFAFNQQQVEFLTTTSGLNFSYNNFSYGGETYASTFTSVDTSSISYNIVLAYAGGFAFLDSSNNEITHNNIAGLSLYGIRILANSVGNHVFENVVNGNVYLTSCDGLQFYGGSVTGEIYFEYGMSNIASLGSVAGSTVSVGEIDSGQGAVRIISNSSVTDMEFEASTAGTNYRFDDSRVEGVDFAASSRVDLNGSSCFNCTFGVVVDELLPCYDSCICFGYPLGVGCGETSYSQILSSYAVKLTGDKPGLYYSTVASDKGTGVRVQDADGAVIFESKISGTQGLYVLDSTDLNVSYVTFEPDAFEVNWELRETLSSGGEYAECTGGSGLESVKRLSFAAGQGGSGVVPCDFGVSNCLWEYAPGYSISICGCYPFPMGDVPVGCGQLGPSGVSSCSATGYSKCYGNWGNPAVSVEYCAGGVWPPVGGGGGGPGYEDCLAGQECLIQPAGVQWVCDDSAVCGINELCCTTVEWPDYDSCAEQDFPEGVCQVSSPSGYWACEPSDPCGSGFSCWCPIPFQSCQNQGYADGVCQVSSPSGYGTCGAGEPCGSGMSCWCPLPGEAYPSCVQQGFEKALCNVIPPFGTELCSGSTACGAAASCWCPAAGFEQEELEWCGEPSECVAPIDPDCVSNWIPFIVVDGSNNVNIRNALFAGEGVLIDVEGDSNWVYIEDNEFQDEALVYLRGDYSSFKNNSFSMALGKNVGIDVLGNGNTLDGFTLHYSQGINVWGGGNKVSKVSFGESGVDYDLVVRGRNNDFYDLTSGKAAFVAPTSLLMPLGYQGELFAFSSFDGLTLVDNALVRYLSGSTGALSFQDSSSTLDREWVVTLQVLNAEELPVEGASASFESLALPEEKGYGITDKEGFVEFNVTEGLFDFSSSQSLPAGLKVLSFESALFNPYLFTASGEGFGEASRELDVWEDSEFVLDLLEANFESCAAQGYADGECLAAMPPAYHACGGNACGDGLLCYCPPAAQPSPSTVPGIYLGIVGLSRNQLPGTVTFGVVLQVDGQGVCSEDLEVVVSSSGESLSFFPELTGCDLRTGLHSYEMELTAPGVYEVLANGGGKSDRVSFSLIAQQPVATPDSNVFVVALAGLLALYALKKK